MGIVETSSPKYWNYFLALEADVIDLSRYIEFTKDNFTSYSMETAKIILSAASEADVMAKQLCKVLDDETETNSIGGYKEVLVRKIKNFSDTQVIINRYGLELTPWINWTGKEHPDWWSDYNKVKHHRHDHFMRANLKNALNAMAGLFVLLIFYRLNSVEYPSLSPRPVLFDMPDLIFFGPDFWGDGH